jgi:hypothetical protein
MAIPRFSDPTFDIALMLERSTLPHPLPPGYNIPWTVRYIAPRRAGPRGGTSRTTEIYLVLCRLFTRDRFNNGASEHSIAYRHQSLSSFQAAANPGRPNHKYRSWRCLITGSVPTHRSPHWLHLARQPPCSHQRSVLPLLRVLRGCHTEEHPAPQAHE